MASKPRAHRIDKKWRSEDVKLQETASFTSLLLSESVLAGLASTGFKTPSPIQLEAIPVGRFGKDLVVQAKSGTGKTLVFTIVALEMLLEVKHPQVLILAPTREIAFQICSVIKAVGSEFKDLKCYTFIGGTDINEDKKHAHSCQIAVGTPGRIKQLINLQILKTNSIRLFILDEADQLLEESFLNDVDDIFITLPKDKQVIATSATYPKKLKKLVDRYFRKPYLARLNAKALALLGIVHYTYFIDSTDMAVLAYKKKLKCLEMILTTVSFSQCLIFCNMVAKVQQLCSDIKKWGFSTVYISSAKEQADRLKAIDALKRFKCKILVSSDLTARGIDAENVDLIINFDVPLYTDVYLHRSGRAGRYGSKGVCVTFVTEKDFKIFKAVEKAGNFKTYQLPDPIPENLVNIRPQDYLEKVLIEHISSEEQITHDSVEEENNLLSVDEDAESESSFICDQFQTSVDEASQSSLEGNIDPNSDTRLNFDFEVKLIETNQGDIPLVNTCDADLSTTESATSQSDVVECESSDNKPDNSSNEIIKTVEREEEDEDVINNDKVVTIKGVKELKQLKHENEKVDACKSIDDLNESSQNNQANSNQSSYETKENVPPTASNTQSVSDEDSFLSKMYCKISSSALPPEFEEKAKCLYANSDKKSFKEVTKNSIPTGSNIQGIKDQDNDYLKDMCSTLSNFIVDQKNNKDITAMKVKSSECNTHTKDVPDCTTAEVKSSECNIHPKDVSNNSAKLSDKSSNEKICFEDIARLRGSLTDYYLSVYERFIDENMPIGSEANDLEKKDESENVTSPNENEGMEDMNPVLRKHSQKQNGSESDSMEDTESSSEIESTLKHNDGKVIFTAKSTDGSFAGSSSSSSEPLGSVVVLPKKAKHSSHLTETSSENEGTFESTPKKNKGEVIYTQQASQHKSTGESSDSSSSDDWEAVDSVLLLKQKFKEVVQKSYKNRPPQNGFMPKLSKSTCKKIAQQQSQDGVSQRPVFISSSGSSETSSEESSETSTDIDFNEIQRPKQRRGQNTSSAYSMSANTSRGKLKQMRRSSKSQSSRKSSHQESCNLIRNNEPYNYSLDHDVNDVLSSNHGAYSSVHGYSQCINSRGRNSHGSRSQCDNQQPYNHGLHYDRSNQETFNAGHGDFQCTNYVERNSHCSRSQYANQQPYNHEINYVNRSNQEIFNAGHRNSQCTNSMESNTHCCRSQYSNGLPSSCTQSSPNQCGIPCMNLGCQSHMYNQWYETFQRQWQCIHNSTYFQ